MLCGRPVLQPATRPCVGVLLLGCVCVLATGGQTSRFKEWVIEFEALHHSVN